MWLTDNILTVLAVIGGLVVLSILMRVFRQVRLQSMVDQLAPGASIRVFYHKANYFNAMATNDEAGNRIVIVFKKLYKALNTNELNFILAHEISHHLHNHLIVQTVTQGLTGGVLEALRPKGFLEQIGIPIATKEPPWWWKGLNIIANIGVNKLSRDEEFDADQNAVNLIKAAGKPTTGAITALEKIMAQEGTDGLLLQINQMLFGSHPITSERRDRVVSQIALMEGVLRCVPTAGGPIDPKVGLTCKSCGNIYDPKGVTSCPKCKRPNWQSSKSYTGDSPSPGSHDSPAKESIKTEMPPAIAGGDIDGPRDDDTKICPMCAETVKAKAKICRFCRHEFQDVGGANP